MFGDNTNVNILLSMATKAGVASIILRIIFGLLLAVHIPYIFYVTKEALLVLIDEIWHSSVSKNLEDKLLSYKGFREADYDYLMTGIQPNLSISDIISDDIRSEVSGLAYKKLPDYIYNSVTLALYTVIVIGAILANNLTTMFNFIGALGGAFLFTVVPALLMLLTL